jgi:parallel beta-helix repeat protein
LNQGRRHFITQLSALTLAIGLLLPGRARAINSTRVAIDREASNIPAGVDCTALIQEAIDSLPAVGGEIALGPGEYMIDALRSLRLRSNVSLILARGAILRALPNAAGSYAIVLIQAASNVRITGGAIVGDLDEHKASVGEWGMGIAVRNSHGVTLENIHVSKCWGDGIYIGSTSNDDNGACSGLVLRGIVAQSNRRQGVSIVACRGALVDSCSFLDTAGTAPAAGIDLEPNAGQSVQRVKITNCVARGNQGTGFQLYAKEAGARIVDCSVDGGMSKFNGAYGVRFAGTSHCQLRDSEITNNGDLGIFVQSTARNCTLEPSSLSTNLRRPKRRIAAFINAMDASIREAVIENGAVNVTIRVDGQLENHAP